MNDLQRTITNYLHEVGEAVRHSPIVEITVPEQNRIMDALQDSFMEYSTVLGYQVEIRSLHRNKAGTVGDLSRALTKIYYAAMFATALHGLQENIDELVAIHLYNQAAAKEATD